MAKAPNPPQAPRAWQRMLSGRRLDLLEPSPLDVEIEDIAHGLARVARWNGQTHGAHAFSVAQHCVLVEQLMIRFYPTIEQRWRLAALLHDASEYVIGDMISPFKVALGYDYKSFEGRLMEAVHVRFGLPAHLPDEIEAQIKRADKASAFFEATVLAGFSDAEAARFFGRPRGLDVATVEELKKLKPLPAEKAGAAFMKKFSQLRL